MTNILYDLQLSVIKDGKFIISTDSNVNVAKFTIFGLLEQNPDYHFVVLVPRDYQCDVNPKEIFKHERITVREYPYFKNSFVDRMSFDSVKMAGLLKDIKIDLVMTNDPCKVLPYKTLFHALYGEIIPVIARNHWVTGQVHRKQVESIDYVIRQTEGAIYADYSTFNSEAAIQMMLEGGREFFKEDAIQKAYDKCVPVETVDSKKMDKYGVKGQLKLFPETVILFAHRLSYYTGFDEVFEVLDRLHSEGHIFIAYFPDPGNKFSQEELKKAHPYIQVIDKSKWTHEDYCRLCWQADIAIGNHNIPTSWGGLSLTEPMAAYTCPLMPKKDAYLEMFYETDDVFFKDKNEMYEKLKCLLENPDLLEKNKELAGKFAREELSQEKYLLTLEHLINSSIIK